MKTLISIAEVAGQPGYVIEDAGWARIQQGGDNAIVEFVDCLTRLIRFLDDLPSAPSPRAETTCLPQPRPCPPYYQIPACTEAGRLVENMPYHLATGVLYGIRAGKKPGNSAEEDCRKAADHFLMEADRLHRITESQNW